MARVRRRSGLRRFGDAILKWWPIIAAVGVILGALFTNWLQVVTSQAKMESDITNLSQQEGQFHNETLLKFQSFWTALSHKKDR